MAVHSAVRYKTVKMQRASVFVTVVHSPLESSILKKVAAQYDIPLRGFTPDIAYRGDFYGQTADYLPYPEGISIECYLRMLNSLEPGFNESACHPGNDPQLNSIYRDERMQELRVLCDPNLRAEINRLGIQLCSFIDYNRMKKGHVK